MILAITHRGPNSRFAYFATSYFVRIAMTGQEKEGKKSGNAGVRV
jgi:hypothetical protein